MGSSSYLPHGEAYVHTDSMERDCKMELAMVPAWRLEMGIIKTTLSVFVLIKVPEFSTPLCPAPLSPFPGAS